MVLKNVKVYNWETRSNHTKRYPFCRIIWQLDLKHLVYYSNWTTLSPNHWKQQISFWIHTHHYTGGTHYWQLTQRITENCIRHHKIYPSLMAYQCWLIYRLLNSYAKLSSGNNWQKCCNNTLYSIHKGCLDIIARLKLRKLGQQLIDEDLTSTDVWWEEWAAVNQDGLNIKPDPAERLPQFDLNRRDWTALNCIQTGPIPEA